MTGIFVGDDVAEGTAIVDVTDGTGGLVEGRDVFAGAQEANIKVTSKINTFFLVFIDTLYTRNCPAAGVTHLWWAHGPAAETGIHPKPEETQIKRRIPQGGYIIPVLIRDTALGSLLPAEDLLFEQHDSRK